MRTLITIIKPYLKALPLVPEKYLFKKKLAGDMISVQLDGVKHPVYLREGTSDIPTFNQVFYRLEYGFSYPSGVKTIVDCGANIGLASIYFANRFPDAKIIAIEPESSNFEMLKKNTAPYPNIECLQYGIWNHTTNLEITDTGLGKWAFMTREVDHENEHTIKGISIDEIISRYKMDSVDLLKIDIEGAEKEVFEKNAELWMPKIKTLIIELHDRYKRGCSKSFFKALVNYDYVASQKEESIICYFDEVPTL